AFEQLACLRRYELNPEERLRKRIVKLPLKSLPFLEGDFILCDSHEPGMGRSDGRLVRQRCQEGRFGFGREIAIAIEGAKQSDDCTAIGQRREYGRPPGERPENLGYGRCSQPALQLASGVCVDYGSFIRRVLLTGYERRCLPYAADGGSNTIRHTGGADAG